MITWSDDHISQNRIQTGIFPQTCIAISRSRTKGRTNRTDCHADHCKIIRKADGQTNRSSYGLEALSALRMFSHPRIAHYGLYWHSQSIDCLESRPRIKQNPKELEITTKSNLNIIHNTFFSTVPYDPPASLCILSAEIAVQTNPRL